ncbi:MAG TPA: peptidoglycan DD-metalloendopeptidase family protein [Acidimicrobiales bacterium]|nr:peptidoglycan DD-metalloendopeptidase family protein [Acidimicrobiales bacterium]
MRSPRAALALILAVCLAAPVPALAEPRSKASEIQSLREQISHASAEEAELLDRVDALADVRRKLDAEVAEIDGRVTSVQAEVDKAQADHELALAELNHVRVKLEEAKGRLADGRKLLARRAVAAYVGNPAASAANAMLEVQSIRDVEKTRVFFRVLVDAQQRQVDKLQALREDARDAQEVVTAQVDEAKKLFDEHNAGLLRLQSVRAEADAVRDRARNQEEAERAVFAEARSRTDELEERLAALKAESDTIGNILRLRGAGTGSRPGALEPPIPFAAVTSRFGPRTHPILGTVRVHTGIDLRAGTGTPVRAAGDGEVILAGVRGGYGNAVVVGHGGNLATLNAHLSSILVSPGQQVKAGQIVGLVGSTGMSTGPHLHFEVRIGGTPVDPLPYLS